jgi:bacillolysin
MRYPTVAGAALIALSGIALSAQYQPARPVEAATIAATSVAPDSLRIWDSTVNRMVRDGGLVLRKSREDTVLSGRRHERYDQFVGGVRVFGADVARQVNGGITESIFGQVYSADGFDARPSLSEDDARAIFGRLSSAGMLPATRQVELVVLPQDDGSLALAYRAHVWSAQGWMHTFIDARTGEIAHQYNDMQTQSAVGSGTGVLGDRKKISVRHMSDRFVADDMLRPPTLTTYDAGGDYRLAERWLYAGLSPTLADAASDTDNVWTDAASVDAHTYLGWTYDFYAKRFGRRGIDDRDGPIRALTHPIARSAAYTAPAALGDYFVNAFWCPGCGPNGKGMMMFGEGLPDDLVLLNGQSVDYLSGALDIIAHELTHGLTDYSSQLIYERESGALNESFSDIIGTSTEFYFQESGSGLRQADYLIGEDVFRPGGVRSLANPGVFNQPDHYSARFLGGEDFGGVHRNSGIPNHAFYLAIEGGVNRTSGIRVDGVGAANREQVEKAFYRAFVYMLHSNARFTTARAATIQAATDLYGASSSAVRAITQAWTAVGVN